MADAWHEVRLLINRFYKPLLNKENPIIIHTVDSENILPHFSAIYCLIYLI